jgi:hypothetical protein
LCKRLYLESFFCDRMSALCRAIGFRRAGAIALHSEVIFGGGRSLLD